MPERSTISQVVNVGVEATPGTAVTANRRLQGVQIQPSVESEADVFRPQGFKYGTVQALNKEWAAFDLSGQPTYDEMAYVLSSVLTTATPTQIATSGAYTWAFQPSTSADDTPKTFTIEQGSGFRAHRFSYGLVTEIGLEFTRDGVSLSGSGMGQRITDNVTLAASPTALPLVPIIPSQVDVFLDTTSAGLGTTRQTRVLSATINLGDRFAPLWVLDSTQTSWVAHVESEPTATIDLTLEADAQGMAFLDRIRDGATRFLRIQATGGQAGNDAANKYRFRWDAAVKVEDVGDWNDQDGVFGIDITLRMVHDATWGRAYQAELINTTSAL